MESHREIKGYSWIDSKEEPMGGSCEKCDIDRKECLTICGDDEGYYKKIDQEKLYICDHAEECGSKVCDHVSPHAGNTRFCKHTYCVNNGMNGVKCIPYKEKSEPKTKRIAVIWIGDVPECTDYVDIRARQHGNEWDKGKEFKANTIDYDLVTVGFGGLVDGGSYKTYKVINPPKQETEEEVMERMPNADDHKPDPGHFAGPIDYSKFWLKMMDWQKDLKAAQDREDG